MHEKKYPNFKIGIIGGTGSFGAFYARLFKMKGFEVFINSRNEEEGKEFCSKNKFKPIKKEELVEMDIVIVSVPNEVAPKVVNEIPKYLGKGTLLFDVCSVKSYIVPELEKLKGKGIELASIHPMHGPRVISISNYPIVLIEIEKGEKFRIIKEFFENESGNVFFSDKEEHDKTLSIVQGLTHYSQFVSATTIKSLGINLEDSLKFASPNYSLFLGLMSRVVLQNPELYSQIQLSNPYNEEVRKEFGKCARKLHELCENDKAINLEKIIINDAQIFKHAEIFLMESDKAVKAQKETANFLRQMKGREILIENMLNNHFHYGKLIEINNKDILLEEGKNETLISIPKVRICSKEELKKWKKSNMEEKYLDYSFKVPEKSDAKIIFSALKTMKEIDVELLDEYKSKEFNGEKSLTYRIKFFENSDKNEIDKKVKKFISGLGYEMR